MTTEPPVTSVDAPLPDITTRLLKQCKHGNNGFTAWWFTLQTPALPNGFPTCRLSFTNIACKERCTVGVPQVKGASLTSKGQSVQTHMPICCVKGEKETLRQILLINQNLGATSPTADQVTRFIDDI